MVDIETDWYSKYTVIASGIYMYDHTNLTLWPSPLHVVYKTNASPLLGEEQVL